MRKTILMIISIIITAIIISTSVSGMDLISSKDDNELLTPNEPEKEEPAVVDNGDSNDGNEDVECSECGNEGEESVAGEVAQSPSGGCLECNEIVSVITNYAFDYANSKITLPEGQIFEGNWIDIIQDILRGVGQTFKSVRQWIGYYIIGIHKGIQEYEDELPFTAGEAVSGSFIVFILEFVLGGYGGPITAAAGASLEVFQYLQALCNGEDYTGLTDLSLLISEPVSMPSNTMPTGASEQSNTILTETSTQSNMMPVETTSTQSTESGSMSL